MVSFDKAFVSFWSNLYFKEMGESLEDELFTAIGPAAAKRGYFEKPELAKVGEWKTRRVRSRLAENSEEDVRDITKLALSAPLRIQHRVLNLLHGIGDPVSSAVLTVWDPKLHTVLDFRAVGSLTELRQLGAIEHEVPRGRHGGLPDYVAYLGYCRDLADGLQVELRSLDRALWKWNQRDMPQTW